MSRKKREFTLPLLPRTVSLNLTHSVGNRFTPGEVPKSFADIPKEADCWLGLDLSISATGIAIITSGLMITGRAVPGEAKVSKVTGLPLKSSMVFIPSNVDRMDYIVESIEIVIEALGARLKGIAIEGFSHASMSSSMDRIHALGWFVRKALDKLKCKKYLVPPTTLKLAGSGIGSADKAMMAASGAEHHNISIEDIRANFPIQSCNSRLQQRLGGSDEIDAFFLALIAQNQSVIKVPKVKEVNIF